MDYGKPSPFELWRRENLSNMALSKEILELIVKAFEGGQLSEREECAKVAEEGMLLTCRDGAFYKLDRTESAEGLDKRIGGAIAEAIRARGDVHAIDISKKRVDETAKDRHEWVGLTDEEMNEAMEYWSDSSRSSYGGAESASEEYVDMVSTWRYIEAKLKEKNT
jgi:hypothetical protein